ncbi:MAG: signal recognition particle-docking protein FtsY [Planctomycetota bacterium]|nr:signal recognition particle-docking protein FtsY [Planctomycetota bacterium]
MEDAYKMRDIRDQEEIMQFLQKEIARELHSNEPGIPEPDGAPVVLLIVGVNGSGKTTTVAKLARILKQNRKKVLLGACDTFRAAATEQLTIWSERVGVPIVRHQEGADPGAVAYDACEAAMARNADYLIIDTAGRLHTKSNLMKELEKIGRVIEKKMPGAKRETLIVLDGTTGMNALQQAKLFNKSIPLDGVIITKLDGTAKGGIAVAVRRELGVPIKFIGIGEGMDDMHPFDPEDFARALFS